MVEATALPNPAFEGSEKRLEVDFLPATRGSTASLRALRRDQLDELMTLACCTIVSQRSNEQLDAYVLSESSLFVYPTKWVLKTCGTTRLLHSVPRLLEMAAELGLEPVRCKYTRASFLFPEQQLYPHCCADNEFRFLHRHFGHMDAQGGQAVVIGELEDGLQWHVYSIESPRCRASAPKPTAPMFNLEVCMTELGRTAARQFYRDGGFVSASDTTSCTGISDLLPGALIDDYVFEPCGYSMNGIVDSTLMTIHVTPEAGHSYASLEMSGCPVAIGDPHRALSQALRIFCPARFSLTLSTTCVTATAAMLEAIPHGYACCAAQLCDLPGGGRLSYYTFAATSMAAQAALGGGVEMHKAVPGGALAALKLTSNGSCLSMQSLFDECGGDTGVSCSPEGSVAEDGGSPSCRCCRGGSSGSDITMTGCDSEGEVGCSSEGDC